MPAISGTTALGKPITPPNFTKPKPAGIPKRNTNLLGTPKGQPQNRSMQDLVKRMARNRLQNG